MKTSWKLFSVKGVDIELHITTLLLVALFFVSINYAILLLVLFTTVILHELSHSFVAKGEGISVEKITLLPIGGMASIKKAKMKPVSEFQMSVAGPLFNLVVCTLVLAAVTALGLPIYNWASWQYAVIGEISKMAVPFAYSTLFISSVFWMNYLLAIFNLFVPAIPLDGGRVFRSFLAMKKDYLEATQIATKVSTIITFLLFIYAVLSFNIILIAISIFIYFGASSELEYAMTDKMLSDFPIKRLLRNNFLKVGGDETLAEVLSDMIQSKSLVAFSRTDLGMNMASIYDIKEVPRVEWGEKIFMDIAREMETISPDLTANEAMREMVETGEEVLLVEKDDKVIGCVFKDDLNHVYQALKVKHGQ